MAEGTLAIGILALVIAAWAAWSSHKSREAADRSAAAAERSAATSDEVLEFQRDERAHRLRADVVPVKWESRVRQEHTGLVVTNRGQSVASNVRGECLIGSLFRAGYSPSLMPGETVGFRDELKEFKPRPKKDLGDILERADGEFVARVLWTNEEGTKGSTDWLPITRY